MGKPLQADYRVKIEEFRDFIDDRPDWEKWELIDGEIVLNPTPTNRHQIIVNNLLGELYAFRKGLEVTWQEMPGVGLRLPGDVHQEPEPDAMIVPKPREVANWTSEAIVVFEVLSPFSVRRDMVHKLGFYRLIKGLTHYVVLAQDRQEATVFARSHDFSPRRVITGSINIEPLGVALALEDIYRGVPLD